MSRNPVSHLLFRTNDKRLAASGTNNPICIKPRGNTGYLSGFFNNLETKNQETTMKKVTLMAMFLSAVVLGTPFSVAQAGDVVFKGKQHSQHDLQGWEQKKMLADFNKRFASTESGAFQKLNNNLWAAKKDKQKARSAKMLGMTANWGSCREYAYKQRG